MKSIKARYEQVRRKLSESYSTYICFSRTIEGQKFSYESISKNFSFLVDKDDYAKNERNQILRHLHCLSNTLEEHELGQKNRL